VQNYPYTDYDPFVPHLQAFCQKLEFLGLFRTSALLKKKEVQDMVDTLLLIQNSRIRDIFCDSTDNLRSLYKLLENDQSPKLKQAAVCFILGFKFVISCQFLYFESFEYLRWSF